MLVGGSSDTYQLSHLFREGLQFIVMTGMVVTLLEFAGLLHGSSYPNPS